MIYYEITGRKVTFLISMTLVERAEPNQIRRVLRMNLYILQTGFDVQLNTRRKKKKHLLVISNYENIDLKR